MKMKAVVGTSSKPSLNSFFKKINTRNFYEWISLPYYVMELQTPESLNKTFYTFFCWSRHHRNEPTLNFFECLGLQSSQDANGFLNSIKVAFGKFNLSLFLDKMVFLSSDRASVKSWKKLGLISLFREQNEWMTFIWCFSHQL